MFQLLEQDKPRRLRLLLHPLLRPGTGLARAEGSWERSERGPFVPLLLMLLAPGQGRILGCEGSAPSWSCPRKSPGTDLGKQGGFVASAAPMALSVHAAPQGTQPARTAETPGAAASPVPHTWLTRSQHGAQHPGLRAEAAGVWLQPHKQCWIRPRVRELRGKA